VGPEVSSSKFSGCKIFIISLFILLAKKCYQPTKTDLRCDMANVGERGDIREINSSKIVFFFRKQKCSIKLLRIKPTVLARRLSVHPGFKTENPIK